MSSRRLETRTGGRRYVSVLVVPALSLLVVAGVGQAATAPPAASAEAPTDAEVRRAVSSLMHDPNLAGERKFHTLRFVHDGEQRAPASAWAQWIRSAFAWFASTARWLFWLLVAALVGLVLITLRRLLRVPAAHTQQIDLVEPSQPTHVGALDIRAESLPEEIGAAALQLWSQGEGRAALSLLYRGMLSRLVHEHGIAIRSSTTEDECVSLARPHLAAARAQFVAGLVDLWQRAVYGGQIPDADTVSLVCAEFDASLRSEQPSAVGTSP